MPEMTTIMLIRHGETAWNKEEIFRGRADVELNETGLRQAQLLAEYLAGEKISAVYSSPLKRALQTAEKIAVYQNLNVTVSPELNDFDFGQWQGLPLELVKKDSPTLFEEWRNYPHLVKIPGAENLEEVKNRALSLIDKVISRAQGVVVLVSHRVTNKVLICTLLGLDNSHFWNIRVDTCSITMFNYENNRFVLVRHNDTSFLNSLKGSKLIDF
jgi:broad specificity phosphatase PhoE